MSIIRDTDRGRLLTRRAFMVGGAQVGLFALLMGRLYDLQILKGEQYRTLAEENRISTRLVLPDRGLILDRNEGVLARNEVNFRAEFVPDQVANPKEALKKFYEILPLEDWEKKRIQRDLKRSRSFLSILLRDNLSWDELALLELRTPELPGVVIEAGSARAYPLGATTAHILGYIGAPTEAEAGNDPLLNQPGFKFGKSGVEKIYDHDLRGVAGSEQQEVNVHGRPVRELARRDGIAGHDVKLSLDMRLQDYVQKRLATEQSASAVVMDAHTGSLYAMASHPSFDPNLFARGISKENFKRLNEDPLKPLLNKALMGQFAPGSTFKVVMTLAALENGISPGTSFFCPGHMEFGNHTFHCWKKQGHGTMDLHAAMVNSCDVYFYRLSQKLGIEPIDAMARKLGMGSLVGIDLPHEKGGLIPNREWKKKRFNENWMPSETLIASIGQGYMLATPLQLAVMTARAINGGNAVVPHVMDSVKTVRRAAMEFPSLGIKKSSLDFVVKAMADVCRPGGTAYGARIPADGYEMGGKTGTSQVRRISKAERAKGVIPNEKRPWEERDHALFVGFAPAHAPRYVVSVVVEHGGGGGKVAGPIARDILIHTQRLDPAHVLPKPLDILPPDEQKQMDNQNLLQVAPPESEDLLPENTGLDNPVPDITPDEVPGGYSD